MKPLLAAKVGFDALEKLTFPLLVSPKLDGIRAIVSDEDDKYGIIVSRTLKLFPNKYTLRRFSDMALIGLDGELIFGPPTAPDVFNQTTRAVMTIEGEPDVQYYVFDIFNVNEPFEKRLKILKKLTKPFKGIHLVEQTMVHTIEELEEAEARFVGMGYEGIMLRRPDAPYKFGRSTLKEGYLVKLKRFEDSEAVIVDIVQLMKNKNEVEVDNLGHQVRSLKKAGMVPMPMVGALSVKDLKTGIRFDVGSGFTEEERRSFWAARKELLGHTIKYRYQPVGVKDKPRFPTFLGFRSVIDI